MRTGTPITLTFDRQETGECTSHVVFADLGLDAMLPGNATTDVELPALPAGEYPFACGMNMVHGLLRVEGEESKDGADKDGLCPRADGSAEAEGVSPSDLRVGAPVVDAAEAERREVAERANEIKALTKLVIVGAVLTLPVFAVTMLHMANPALVPHWMVNPWLQAILITPVMFYCGRPIHTVGFPALAHRSPDMNSLVSLGTSAAYLYSLVTCIAPWVFPEGSREPYFESVGVVITLVLVGRLLETKAREGTGKAVQSLIKLRPRTAHKLNATSADNVDGIEWRNPAHFTDTDIDAIVTGDLLIVKNGERVPTDGVIVAGEARIDESMITGESKPVSRTAGDPVTGATVLLKGGCVMRATQVGADTVLSQIAAMVARAQATRHRCSSWPIRSPVFRAGGDDHRHLDVRHLEVTGPGAATGARAGHRGQCADHRLPVRAGTGHAAVGDGLAGLGRHQRRAGHQCQGAGTGASHRHRGVRQDRHHHARRGGRGRRLGQAELRAGHSQGRLA